MKALQLRPGDRYQSADAMRAALEAFADRYSLRTSTSALAAYMKQQFGERPEPWLIDDDDVEMEVTVDFDGSASGLAPPPPESRELLLPDAIDAEAGSPIMKARTKANTGQPANKTGPTKVKPLTAQIPVLDSSKPKRGDPTPIPAPRRDAM